MLDSSSVYQYTWARLWQFFGAQNIFCDTIPFDSVSPSQVTNDTAYP